MTARPGEMLGRYRLGELLGEGGMGRVYLAAGPDGQAVAVKVLRQGGPGEDNARARLAREVDTMRRVRSPFVAAVLGADIAHDPPYIVTQFADGRTLEEVVEGSGPLSGPALASVAHGLAAALAAIHAAGVVHRDLKPANVMLTGGKPVVIDFGIAQALEQTRLTMTGMFIGTPGYLAPEIIEGRPPGPAADVHSWAATVIYAAAGRPPFGSGPFEAIFYRIMHGEADLGTLPAPLRPVITAALARDPAARPAAAQLVTALAAINPASLVPSVPATLPVTLPATIPAAAALAGRPGAAPALLPPPGPGYSDLLPPVAYQRPAQAPAPAQKAPARPDEAPAAAPWRLARPALVAATVVTLIAAGVLFPPGGAVAAVVALILARAAGLSVSRAGQRRAAGASAVAAAVPAAAGYPWAVARSGLRFLALAPGALLAAAVVAVLTVISGGAAELPTAVSYAAGALVAWYALGPGSASCRAPLGRCYGRLTRSAPAAVTGTLVGAVVAIVVVAVTLSTAPGFWPDPQLGTQLHAAANHPALQTAASAGRSLLHWLGVRLG